MAKTASTIAIKEMHRREYRRTVLRLTAGSIVLWFILVLFLAGSHAGSAIVPVSILMLVGLIIIRVNLWNRYRRDMRVELAGQNFPQGEDGHGI
ncbi:MAG TPA: hypothetical protein VIH47_10220 [Solirubrobacterales bacterium]